VKKIGFIDYYLDEWHANNLPKWVDDASGGRAKVCYAWGEIDSPNAKGRTGRAWAQEMGVELCASIEEVIQKSDCLVVLSPDNPERHEDLCRLPLVSGKPNYVDKTFSVDAGDARRIIDGAKGTPFFSCSALRYADELKDCGEIEVMESHGPGKMGNYLIHQVEPVFVLMGKARRVVGLGGGERPTLMYDFGDGRRATVNFNDGGFGANIRRMDGSCRSNEVKSDFFKTLTAVMLDFFETGREPFPREDAYSVMAMVGAGKKAAACPGEWIGIN
jgi:hypothetical protein